MFVDQHQQPNKGNKQQGKHVNPVIKNALGANIEIPNRGILHKRLRRKAKQRLKIAVLQCIKNMSVLLDTKQGVQYYLFKNCRYRYYHLI